MKDLKLFITLGMTLLAVMLANAGSVSIQAIPQTVQKGHSVTVTVSAQGKEVTFPSIDHIGPYPINAPQISQNIEAKYVNGSFSAQQKKTMRFSFFPDKNITIPPLSIQVDGQTRHTQALAIHVRSAAAGHAQNGYRLEMIPSTRRVYVGQPLVLNVVFFEPRNSQVTQAQYVPPKFDGFFVKSDNQEQLQQDAQGTSHIFTYILTPQKEGNFTITAPQIKLGIRTFSGARDPWGFFNNDVRWQALQASPVTIHVRPVPSPVDLVGDFKMNATVDSSQVPADKPVNYTLTIEGTGSLEDIDDPKFDLNDVTVYSDDAQVSSRIQNGHIISHWVKKYTFIADHDFTIPALKEKVFNPMTAQVSTLTTPPYPIHVTGDSTRNTGNQNPPAQAPAPAATQTPPALTQTPASTPGALTSRESNRSLLEDTAWYALQAHEKNSRQWPLWALILAFVAGIVAASIAMRFWPRIRRRRSLTVRSRHYSTDEALAILYPHTNDSAEIEAMVRELYQAKQDSNIKVDQEKLGKLIEQVGSRK